MPCPARPERCARYPAHSLHSPHANTVPALPAPKENYWMPTLPDRHALRTRYDEAVSQINVARSAIDLTTGFYARTGDAVFDAGMRAISDACSSSPARVHTIAAPVGGGKTSFAYALMLALTQHADENPKGPYGCAFVCDQIEKADAAYRELNALMPGRVAIWTSDHDKRNPRGEKVAQPAALFTQDELKLYPVIIVTHKFFSDTNKHKARNVVRKQDAKFLHSRSLFIVDERPQDVTAYDLTFADVQALKTTMCHQREDLKEHWEALWTLLSRYEVGHDGNTISRPSVDLGDAANQHGLHPHIRRVQALGSQRALEENLARFAVRERLSDCLLQSLRHLHARV